MGGGDAICQMLLAKSSSVDGKVALDTGEVSRFALAGATLHGPYFYYGFKLMDRVPMYGVKTALGKSLTKTLVTQVTIFPLYLGLLFVYLGVLEGKSNDIIEDKVLTAWPRAYMSGSAFWPVANTVNFLYVPPSWRAPYVAGAGLVWNAIVSWENGRANKELSASSQ